MCGGFCPASLLFMENINEITYEQLMKLIESLIEKKVSEILDRFGIESTSMGKVVSVDKVLTDADGNITKVCRASVELSDKSVVSNLFNASGEILSVGDEIKIYGSKTNMANRYIGIKYEGEVTPIVEQTD